MVTIRDVARAAGVSIATVSRVFNSSPRVSDAARRRVRLVSEKLDYWPNAAARSLTMSRTHALAILLPDLFGEFFSEVIRGIDHAARREKFQIFVSSSHANTTELVAAARSMRGRIDGLIAMVPEHGAAITLHHLSHSFPTVLLNPPLVLDGCRTVSIANFEGAQAAVEHLVKAGRQRVAILKGPAGNADADERLRGYRAALRGAGIELEARYELQGDFTESSGYQAAQKMLRLRTRPNAVFAANDYMAIGFLGAMRDASVRVPEDMAVVGFDDITISQYLSPALTTVHVDSYDLGERAFRSLMAQIGTPARRGPMHDVVPATLVVRESCGAGNGSGHRTHAKRTRSIAKRPRGPARTNPRGKR